ncbi:MAG: hypothetical protein RIR96_762 [Bacteroidota bacterium]
MKKIIAAFDGLNFSESNLKYALQIAEQEKSHLTGVFLDDRTYTSYKIYDLVFEEGVSESKMSRLRHEDQEKRKAATNKFEQECVIHKLNFNVHHDKNYAIKELIHESIFADLLIVSRQESFTHHQEKFPSHFIKETLLSAHCPVLLTPEAHHNTEKIIFLYDGHPDSILALKMFVYLLPGFLNLPIEVISVKAMEDNLHLPDGFLMKEWIKKYFSKSEFVVLKGIPDLEIVAHLQREQSSCMVVLGSYHRSGFSMWLRSSMADVLAKNFDMPLFISHQSK